MSPVGDTAREFQRLAAAEGIDLNLGHSLPWLSGRGHAHPVLREALPTEALAALRGLFLALDGDEQALAQKVARSLSPDFVLGDSEQLVELDESQHFTSARLTTLEFYDHAATGFDLTDYRARCRRLRRTSDSDFAHRTAAEFPGPHGRQRQRAYLDAVRDFGAPLFGHGPVLRIPAPERNARLAFQRFAAATSI